jgi:hypothetical protein
MDRCEPSALERPIRVLLLRMFVGTLVGVAGLICLTVAVERHRLLALIQTLRR